MGFQIRNPFGKRSRQAFIRRPTLEDAPRIAALTRELRQPDRQAAYLYLLLSDHFPTTSVIAELEGLVVGLATGYRTPVLSDTLFVWQVGTAPPVQRNGIGTALLLELLERPENSDVRFVEATTHPDDRGLPRLFARAACRIGAPFENLRESTPTFSPAGQEVTTLLRIGPITTRSS